MGEKIEELYSKSTKRDIINALIDATLNVLTDFENIKYSKLKVNANSPENEMNTNYKFPEIHFDSKDNAKSSCLKNLKSKRLTYKTTRMETKEFSDSSFCSNDTVEYEPDIKVKIPAKIFDSIKTLYELRLSPQILDIKLIELDSNSEIFNRVDKENHEYVVFNSNCSEIDMAGYVKYLIFEFKPEKSTIIISFMYLDLLLNKTKIALNRDNYKK